MIFLKLCLYITVLFSSGVALGQSPPAVGEAFQQYNTSPLMTPSHPFAEKPSADKVPGQGFMLAPIDITTPLDTGTEAGLSTGCLFGCSLKSSMQINKLNMDLLTTRISKVGAKAYPYACPISAPYQTRLTDNYSESRKHPILRYFRPHHGIDFGHPRQRSAQVPIQAVRGGKVLEANIAGGYGLRVVIETDDGHVMTYNHLENKNCLKPKVGVRIGTGAKLGCMGNTGVSTGPHLHFEVYKSKEDFRAKRSMNPKELINFTKACIGRFVRDVK